MEKSHPESHRLNRNLNQGGNIMEREKGIEPSPIAWEAIVLPLNYSRPSRTIWRIAPRSSRAQAERTTITPVFALCESIFFRLDIYSWIFRRDADIKREAFRFLAAGATRGLQRMPLGTYVREPGYQPGDPGCFTFCHRLHDHDHRALRCL